MSHTRAMNVDKEMRGMTVLQAETGGKMGEVSDVIVRPTEGRLTGLIVRTSEGYDCALAAQDILIGEEAVMAISGARLVRGESGHQFEDGIPATGEIVGTCIVSDDGKLLGRVSEVYISIETLNAIYHVTESDLRKFPGGGFYIAGNLPSAYSSDGVRLIVPAGTEERYAVTSLDEAFGIRHQ